MIPTMTAADRRAFTSAYWAQVHRGRGYTYETITQYRGETWMLRTNDEKTSIKFAVGNEAFITRWMLLRRAAGDVNAFEKYIPNEKAMEAAA